MALGYVPFTSTVCFSSPPSILRCSSIYVPGGKEGRFGADRSYQIGVRVSIDAFKVLKHFLYLKFLE
jgi:hypothetical protein